MPARDAGVLDRPDSPYFKDVFRSGKEFVFYCLVMLSSRIASIASYDRGGRYFYRSAKVGLNALVKSLAIDLAPRGVVSIALSPGWYARRWVGQMRSRRSRKASPGCYR